MKIFVNYFMIIYKTGFHNIGARGGAVGEAPRYKPDGSGFDSRWCHWNFSLK